jgi:hypothetical protein
MKLLIACLVVLSLLFCLPAAACPPATQAVVGAGYGDSCAAPVSSLGSVGYGMPVVAQAPAYGVGMSFGAGGYGAMAAPVALAPVRRYGMVRSFGAVAPLYGGFSSGAAFGAPVVHQTVVVQRPGLLGRLRAARQGFRRGF